MALSVDSLGLDEAIGFVHDRQAFELHNNGWIWEHILGECAWSHPLMSKGAWVTLSTAVKLNRGGV